MRRLWCTTRTAASSFATVTRPGRDPLIDFEAPADGDYVVGLYDFIYAGGGDYYYRL